MQAKGVFTVGKGALLPEDERAREIMAALQTGERVLCWTHKARWPEHHRLAFKLFSRVGEAIGKDTEWVKTWLKVQQGRLDFMQMPNGKVIPIPQSVSFESMSQDEFQKFWDEALLLICEHLLPTMKPADFDDIRAIIAKSSERAAA